MEQSSKLLQFDTVQLANIWDLPVGDIFPIEKITSRSGIFFNEHVKSVSHFESTKGLRECFSRYSVWIEETHKFWLLHSLFVCQPQHLTNNSTTRVCLHDTISYNLAKLVIRGEVCETNCRKSTKAQSYFSLKNKLISTFQILLMCKKSNDIDRRIVSASMTNSQFPLNYIRHCLSDYLNHHDVLNEVRSIRVSFLRTQKHNQIFEDLSVQW